MTRSNASPRKLIPEFAFVDYAETRLYQLSASYTRRGVKSWKVADEIRAEIELCLLQAHGGAQSLFLDLPGEAAWRTIVEGSVRDRPLCAEVTYIVQPTFLHGDYVPIFEVYVITPKRPSEIAKLKAA